LPPLPGSRPYRTPVCWRSRRNRHHAQEAESARPVARQPNGQGTCPQRRLPLPRLSSQPRRRSTPARAPPPCSPPARSGSERPRRPPQVGPQPTHPVHQSIPWHPEVYGDVGITPAVNNPAFQQDAVICGQVPEEGAKSVRGSLHWGDLGGQDDTPGQAGFPGTSLPVRPLPAPRHTWNHVRGQRNAPEIPRLGISSCGDALPGGIGIPWTPAR
jgi:hypothetical protein